MSVQVKHRRDTAANIAAFTPAQGEIVVDTTNNRMIVGDGATAGGFAAAKLSEVAISARRAVADASTTITSTDRLIAYVSLTASRTVSLPAASAYPATALLRIVDESGNCSSSNTITIDSSGSDTINGASSFVMNGPYTSVLLECDGVSKWTLLNNETVDAFSYVGVGTAPDPSNVLSVYGSSALLNGANFSLTVNKSATANAASVLFQDGFSARAQIGLLGDDNFTFKVSPNGSSYYSALSLDKSTGAVTLGNARTAVADANYVALTTDREIAFTSISAARTVTLPVASGFPSGHALVIVDESGSVSLTNTITISRAGSDTIAGQTGAKIVTPYGHCRLVSNGSNGWIVAGRSINIQTFAATGTYIPTPGLAKCDVYLIGGGGGGGGGALQAASTASSGGAGGGGGGIAAGSLFAVQIGASAAVTIGAAGSAGAAATVSSTAGGNGGNGGSSQFGTFFKALGGAGGAGGQLAANSGGGGGGLIGSAGAGAGSTGGGAAIGGSAGGSGAASTAVFNPGGGSGGGGGVNGAAGASSGNSLFGASGGAGGGGVSAANATSSGGAGGYAPAGGASGAYQTALGGAAGVAGANGNAPTAAPGFAGNGAGGGGSTTSGAAGSGGQGFGGGGGGGGGSAQNGGTAGAGGAGGAGYAIVVEYF